jgi:hypothetical protein
VATENHQGHSCNLFWLRALTIPDYEEVGLECFLSSRPIGRCCWFFETMVHDLSPVVNINGSWCYRRRRRLWIQCLLPAATSLGLSWCTSAVLSMTLLRSRFIHCQHYEVWLYATCTLFIYQLICLSNMLVIRDGVCGETKLIPAHQD